ncbi:MAG TPA: SPFH domain-containing protein [Anaerolineae bacterium]|nr:SPFH domain-containing protein [Anaerolineae bacterium]HQH38003.1 SPFH domain-containing protein [Anaerolineae bacterium]
MAVQPASQAMYNPTVRNLNNVQRVQRTLVWFGIFVLIGVITVLLAVASGFLLPDVGTGVAIAVFVVGGLLALIIPGMFSSSLYIVPEYERVIVLKLGKFMGVRGPGRFWVIPYPPFNESVTAQIDLRVQTRVITAAETLTDDNVPVGCEAVIFWRVEDPQKAALSVANYQEAVFQAANSALKDTIGMLELSELLGSRDKVSGRLKEIIDTAAASFGVDVTSVEITDVRVPADLIQELSILAQSRRSAQAKIAEADAEKAIAVKFNEAAELMSDRAMEIYRLNVLERIGREEGSQIVIYGLGGNVPTVDNMLAAAAAGSLTTQ